MSSLLFEFWPPIYDGRFAVAAAYLFVPTFLLLMYGLPLLLLDPLWDSCELIKPVIVAATANWFSAVISTALVFLFLLRASVIFLLVARFLSIICCNSRLSQPVRFDHYLLANILFGLLISTPLMTLQLSPPPMRTLPRPP